MKVCSFNVNSIRQRLHQLAAVRERIGPHILGLQETKVQDADFPIADVEALGWQAVFHGQKTHYGVALLTTPDYEIIEARKGFPHDGDEAQKRLIIADVRTPSGEVVRIINGYFPQGENREHPVKFPAKEKFYRDLMDYLNTECDPSQPLIIMGDFNIAPDDKDIGIGEENRKRWLRQGKTSFLPEERAWFEELLNWGLFDTFRTAHPDVDDCFSWFDYRSRGFEREPKRGLRIDHILATAPLNARVMDAGIDYTIRGMEKPSDHAPVWTEFKEAP